MVPTSDSQQLGQAERLRFETVLADVSARFVGISAEELDREIVAALGRICQALGLDRSAVFQWSPSGDAELTHVWAREGIDPTPSVNLSAQIPWTSERVRDGHIVQFSSIDDLPAEAEIDKTIFRQIGPKASAVIPLIVGGERLGAVVFSKVRAERIWGGFLISRLRVVADMLTNALARRRADEALRVTEQRLSIAMEAAEAGAWSMDVATRNVWCSPRQRELFEFGADEIVTFDLFERMIHADDRALVQAAVDDALRSNSPLVVEFRVVLKNGDIRWIAARGRPDASSRSRTDRLIGISVDITERKVKEQVLAKSQLTIASAMDIARLGFYEDIGPIGQSAHLDPRVRALTGVPPGQPEKASAFWLAHIDPQDRDRVMERRKSLDWEDHISIEYRYLHPERGRIWIRHVVNVMARDEAGTVARAIGVLQDITERKNAEEALRESESINRVTFEQAAVGIAHVALDGHWLRVNDKLCEIAGYTRDELLRLTFHEISHPDDQAVDLDDIRRLLAGEIETYTMEKRYIRKDGSVIHVNLSVSLARSDSGKPQHFISIIEDITERKRAEEALEEERALTLAVVNSTDDFIWSVDPEQFGLLTWNKSFHDYYATKRGLEVAVGTLPHELVSARQAPMWLGYYARALREGSFRTEYTASRVLLLSFYPLKRGGKVFGISVFAKDITDRKRAEEESRHHAQELAHLNRVATMGELTSSIAHELHQPLGAILLNAEVGEMMLNDGDPDLPELKEIISDIRSDGQRAGNVITRLRSLLKRRTVQLQPVALSVVVEEILDLVRGDAIVRNVHLAFDGPATLPPVMADRVHLQQVLLNLIVNAMDAMAERPAEEERHVQISARMTGETTVEVAVRDSGPGIPEKDLTRLFEPFYTTKAAGMGMGLSISRTIIEAHDGRIRAENNPDGGATFFFTLNVAPPAVSAAPA